MLISNGDGTYIAGPLDAILILHHAETGRYHAAFFEERPMPGPVQDLMDVKIVRLMSRMHHTQGGDTLAEAHTHVNEMATKLDVHGNVFRDPVEWGGESGMVLIRDNWRRDPTWIPTVAVALPRS